MRIAEQGHSYLFVFVQFGCIAAAAAPACTGDHSSVATTLCQWRAVLCRWRSAVSCIASWHDSPRPVCQGESRI